jgi:NAD(P)-dependent dehydrogenase (short-subunit alcohol dehydrogenase family)
MAEAGIAELGLDYVVRDIPIGAVVPPEEIANLIVFLAAGKATHVTGSTIDINGASYPR